MLINTNLAGNMDVREAQAEIEKASRRRYGKGRSRRHIPSCSTRCVDVTAPVSSVLSSLPQTEVMENPHDQVGGAASSDVEISGASSPWGSAGWNEFNDLNTCAQSLSWL